MNRSTRKAYNEAKALIATSLTMLIDDTRRILAILDGKAPVTTLKGPQLPTKLPKGRLNRRYFTKSEEDYLDEEGFKELIRLAVNARLFHTEVVALRRHGK